MLPCIPVTVCIDLCVCVCSDVGAEKPRLTEWRCPLSSGSGAVSMALYEMRYGAGRTGDDNRAFQAMMNAYAVPLRSWIGDLLMLRLGVRSTTFAWCDDRCAFRLACTPPLSRQNEFEEHVHAGTVFARLVAIADGCHGFRASMVRDGVVERLRDVLALHREVLTTIGDEFGSMLEFTTALTTLTDQMR